MNFSYLGTLLCLLVTAGALTNSFVIGYSVVQAQQEAQLPSTITYDSPRTDNLYTAEPGNAPVHNAVISSSQTFTNSKNLNLNHSFVSNKVIGPDRFRFVTSYWTKPDTPGIVGPDTPLAIDVGTSANNTFFSPTSTIPLPPNQMVEVDTNEGPSTLAVVLQYEGVVNLAGVTAALKLPAGFTAQLPLTDDRNNYDIALSSYRGHIYPSQGIVLYFWVNVLPTAKVQLPVLGPLALHFLRSSQRSILDSLDASQQNMFAKTLSVMHTENGRFPNSTFNDNLDFKRDYFNQFGRLIPYDFVNQVIPVIFKTTGKEVIDIVTLPTAGKNDVNSSSTQIVQIPYGVTTKVRLAIRNTGDVPIYGCFLFPPATPALQSTLGINGLNPSAITSPNIPQTLFSTNIPLGIVGPNGDTSTACAPGPGFGVLTPHNSTEADFSLFPTHYAAGTVQLLNYNLVYTNVLQQVITRTAQVYFVVTPP